MNSVFRIKNIITTQEVAMRRKETAEQILKTLLAERHTMNYPVCEYCKRRVSPASYSKRHGANCRDKA